MSNFDEKTIERIKRLEREVERLRVKESGKFIALTTPLTSTRWDGDSFSTTGKTLIDLSAVFGIPAGVKAVLAGVSLRDSGSAGSSSGCYLILSPNSTSYSGVYTYCAGLANDAWTHHNITVPCDANGDVYYQINASGSATMDVYLEIWGYWL